MFLHRRDLAFKVRVDNPNPVFARVLQQAIGGPEGEIARRDAIPLPGLGLSRPRQVPRHDPVDGDPGDRPHRAAGHRGLDEPRGKSEQVDEIVTNPIVAACMGALEPRHFLSGGLAAMPSDANACRATNAGGNLIANMRANVAAEAIRRTLACRLLEITDDPGMKDQQQWLAVLEELGPEMATNAPGDFENTGEFADHAYEFINHRLDGVAARFTRLAAEVADRLTPNPSGDAGRDYEAMTKEELLEEARKADIEGRSSMDKEQLAERRCATPRHASPEAVMAG
jgi:Mn-containing catalase